LSLVSAFFARAADHPERVAIVEAGGASVTYRQLGASRKCEPRWRRAQAIRVNGSEHSNSHFSTQDFILTHRDKFGRLTFGRKWVRHDDTEAATPRLPIKLPLKIRRSDDSFSVEDATGRSVSFIHFDDEPSRRAQTRRFSQDEAREIAQMIARLLTDVDAEAGASVSRTIPLADLSAENDE
jgi:hypothetical protein